MQTELTPRDMATILGTSERAVRMRAQKEAWSIVFKKARGGKRQAFILSALPESVRLEIAGSKLSAIAMSGFMRSTDLATEKAAAATARETGLAAFSCLSAARKQAAEAKRQILLARDAFIKAAGLPVKRGSQMFAREFCAGAISLPSWVINAAGMRCGRRSLSWSTLNRWQKAYEAGGLAALAGSYESTRKTSVPEHMQKFITGCHHDHPHISISKLMAGLCARFDGQAIPATSAVRRWVKRWKTEHASLLLAIANPDEWKNRYQFAPGDASAGIVRLNQRWEMDSTPGDVMLKDGRHTIIGVIDIYSRRMKLLVSPTSKAVAVAALIRRALLDWGVPEIIKTDNGSDYVSNHITRVLDDLQIYQDLCAPFTPEQKPHIERGLGTFSHDIIELLPGYIGHSVVDRKAIEARRTFAQRLMSTGSDPVEVNMTAAQFQDICNRWTAAMYHHNAHGGLDGKTPALVAREWTEPVRRIGDVRALDMLLYPAAGGGGYRTIAKKMITISHIDYMAPEMAGHEGERVQVLLDATDLGAVYIYREKQNSTGMKFLCRAVNPELAGVSRSEMAELIKKTQQQVMADGKAEYRKIARKVNAKTIGREILEHREAKIDNIHELPKRSEDYITPMIAEAARAVESVDGAGRAPEPIEITREEETAADDIISLAERKGSLMPSTEWECYQMLSDEAAAGMALTVNEEKWLAEYDEFLLTGKKTGLLAAGFQPFAERNRAAAEVAI